MASSDNTQVSGIDRRQVLKTVGGAAALTTLAGCGGGGGGGGGDGDAGSGGSGGGSGDGTTITVLMEEASDSFQEFFNDVKADFEAEHDATVNMEFGGVGAGASQRMAQLLQSGDPPEVYLTSVAAASEFLSEGVAAPVDDVYGSVTDTYGSLGDNFRLRQEGSDYILPVWASTGNYWYRDDIYTEAPTTWDAALEQAEAADGTDDMGGGWVSAGSSICTDLQMMGWVYSNGGRLAERRDGSIRITIDEGENRRKWVETLDYLKQLHEFSPRNADTGCGDQSQALATEVSAASWKTGSRPKNQSIIQEKEFADDISVVVQPQPGSGSSRATIGLVEGFVTFGQADTTAAQTYLEFLFQPKYLTPLYHLTPLHNLPPYEGMRQSDPYQSQLNELIETKGWTQDDADRLFEGLDNLQTMAGETSPPNYQVGSVLNSRGLSEILYETVIQDRDSGAVVDEYAKQFQSMIDDA
jgi:ABC-type glycerol-3-phosphate transport system substrate-binding protein